MGPNVLTIEQLQEALRGFNNLSGVVIVPKNVLVPWDVVITGFIDIHGTRHFYEAAVDLRTLQSRDHIFQMVQKLHEAFDKAAAGKRNQE